MDQEIDKRLRETSDACLKAYESWKTDKKNGDARESLQEAVHELRKVASRLEIEVAVSERDEMTQKPIPIPPHRDSNKRGRNDDDRGNRAHDDGGNQNSGGGGGKPRGRGRGPKKAAGGEG